jgi:hypothetical protein
MAPSANEKKLRRLLWVLGALVVVLALALAVVLVTRDDDSDSASSPTTTSAAATTTSTPAPATSTPVPTTTVPTTATTATTVPYPPITDDPQVYAHYLFAAWQNASQSSAANVASAEAVTQMFSQAYSSAVGWQFGSCDPAAGTLYCTWTSASGSTLTMQVRTLTGGLPIQVVGVSRS